MTDFLSGKLGPSGEAALGAPAPGARPDAGGTGHPARPQAGGWLLWGLAALAGALLGAGILLWARNGSAVFFDVMSSGIASCL